jgi:transcriptional regulator with XRE-family HTH domain
VSTRDPLLVGLGNAIRDLRDEHHVSQERLGLDSGVHRNYIGGIERAERRPTLTTIATLARALGITPAELVAQAEHHADDPTNHPASQCR